MFNTILNAIFGKKVKNSNSLEVYESPMICNTHSKEWEEFYQKSLYSGYDKNDSVILADILESSLHSSLSLENCISIAKKMSNLCFHLGNGKIELYHHNNPNDFEILGSVSLATASTMHYAKENWIEVESFSRHTLESLDLF